MKERIEYKTNKEKEDIEEANKDKFLIERQNYVDGNFLVFSDEPPLAEPLTLEERVAALEGAVLKKKIL